MSELIKLIVLAAIGEAVWETFKMVWENNKLTFDRVGALFVGLVLALGTGLDLFTLIGIPIIIPYIGMVLTGVLISRGANFVHDLFKKIEPEEYF